MAKPRRSSGTRERSRSWLPMITGLVLFLVFDAVLVGLAVLNLNDGGSSAIPVASASARPSNPGTPVQAVAVPVVQPPNRLLAAWDGRNAWRTTTRDCPGGGAVIEHTTDGGASWRGFDLGAAGRVSSAITLRSIADSDSASLVALTAGACNATWIATYSAGADWAAYSDRLSTSWYVMPTDRTVVYVPGGVRKAPCSEVVQVASHDEDSAAILCSDARVFRTTERGLSWDSGVQVAGALAISQSRNGYVVATGGAAGCAGTAVRSLGLSGPGAVSEPLGCAPATPTARQVAVSASDSTLWLWIDNATLRSTDGGKTWG